MNYPLLLDVPAWILASVFFVLVIIANRIGNWFKKSRLRKYPTEEPEHLGPIEGSLLGLMALLLAFTFGMAASKFDTRRGLIIEEANDIGTAILRCDLYPDSVRNLFLADFKNYVQARIDYYDAGVDQTKIKEAQKKTKEISAAIWKRAASLSLNIGKFGMTQQMIPALNNMIDIVTTRDSGRITKVPPIILMILLILMLVSGFLSGYGYKGKRNNNVMVICFALMITITLYLVMELDRPRSGLLNLDAAEQNIVDLRGLITETR